MTDEQGDGAFLERWSKRKADEAAREEGAANPSPDAPPARPLDEILAELPAVEDIRADTDVRGFLQAGVPPQLRAAALSRLWLADPAIRDRVPDAIDYAENYNAPETIFGWGPADPTQAQALAARAHGFLEPAQIEEIADVRSVASTTEIDVSAEGRMKAVPEMTDNQEIAAMTERDAPNRLQNIERIAKHGSALPPEA
jgi:hypothetical protein